MASVTFLALDADVLGGMQRVTHTVAQGLAERGYQVQVVGVHRAREPVRYVARPGYRSRVLEPSFPGAARGPGRRLARRRLAALLARTPPGYLVLTSPGAVTWAHGLIPGHLKTIGQYHGSYEHAQESWHLRTIRAHYWRLDQSVFLSPEDAWKFTEHALLPNATDLPGPLPAWPDPAPPAPPGRVLGVGRLSGVKRFDRLISAFAAAARSVGGGWELHLIGTGEEEARLRAHAAREGAAVVFRGRVPAERMTEEFRRAAILGLTSEHEGLPLVVGEAAACGVPTVAYDVSGGVRALVTAETGLLVPPGDVPAFARALARLMREEELRRRLGAAARRHAAAFRPERILDRWEELFAWLDR